MTEETQNPKQKPNTFWLDFGPLLIFFGAFLYFKSINPDDAMVWAAGILAIVAAIALLISWLRYKHLSGLLIFSTLLVVGFASLAFFTGDKRFLYVKPTIINTLFGVGVIGGVFLKKNVIKMMMGEAIELPDAKWDRLAIRWGLFFFAMAALNEFIWRTQTEEFWATFKVFGFFPLTFVFTLAQLPFIQKHGKMRG